MRLIPSDTKLKIEVIKGFSIWDLLVGLVCILLLTFRGRAFEAATDTTDTENSHRHQHQYEESQLPGDNQ